MRTIALLLAMALAQTGPPPQTGHQEFEPIVDCFPRPFIVFFRHGSSALDANARATLNEARDYPCNPAPARMFLEGHNDSSEPDLLSRSRVDAVRRAMVRWGFDPRRIVTEASGSRRMRVATPPDTAEPQNRRVEIVFGPLF